MQGDYIAFPNLGWEFPISPELFHFELFGTTISIKWYGVIIAIGFLLAMIYGLKRANYFGIDPDRMIDVVLVSAIFAFIGARLYFVLFYPDNAMYFEDPMNILRIWKGGLGIYGGIIFAFGTAIWMCRVRKVNTLAMFDLASLGFLIGQAVGRWGNFFNQEAFGGNTDLPWGMTGSIIQSGETGSDYILSQPVHPTFLYESLWCLLGLVLLHIVSKKMYKFKGEIFSFYLIWYGIGRFTIESLRTDSLVLGTMKVSQLVAVLAVIGGIVCFFIFKSYAQSLPKDLFQPEPAQGEAPAEGEGAEAAGDDTEAADEAAAEDSETGAEPEPEAAPPCAEDETATAAADAAQPPEDEKTGEGND